MGYRAWTKVIKASILIIPAYIAYQYMTGEINRNSLIVRHALFALKSDDKVMDHLGQEIQVATPILGAMNQRKGYADISFRVVGTNGLGRIPHSHDINSCVGSADISLKAERKGWDWALKSLMADLGGDLHNLK